MPIKRLLTIVTPLVFLVLAVFSVLIFWSLDNYQAALEKANTASKISEYVFQKRLIADDYILGQHERSKTQWRLYQNAIETTLTQNKNDFQDPKEQQLYQTIQTRTDQSNVYFDQLVASYAETGAKQNEKRTQLASQLTIVAQEIILASTQLHILNETSATGALNKIIWLFLTAGLSLFIMLLASFRLVWRSATILTRRKAQDTAILRSIGDGVFAITPQGQIALFNRAAERLTGYRSQEVIGQPYQTILQFYDEKTGAPAFDFIKNALLGSYTAMASRTLLRCKNGTSIPVADSAAPIRAEGKINGVVVVFRDITRERQLAQLKDEFVSIASHELRTPLGAILAFATMLLAGDYGKLNKNLLEPITDIKTSSLRLVELVNDLLDVARIEAGRLKFNLDNVAIDPLAQEVCTTLQPLGANKHITITSTIKKAPLVQVDSAKIKQIFTNLIGNALKFTDKGSITLAARSSGDMLEITVTDTGVGINKEDQRGLFAKFQQVSSTQRGRPIGTGLGLYICRELVRKMGGELWIKKTSPGKGSTFAFTVPLANSAKARTISALIRREAQLHPDQK